MGAISKSEPIFSKFGRYHSRLNSVRYAKCRANRRIYRDFGAPFSWNRTKLYMGAIPNSEPIFTELSTHHSGANSVPYAKFRANQKIYGDFGTPFTFNRAKIYMGAISISEPIFTKFNTHHSRLNLVSYDKFRANWKIYRYFKSDENIYGSYI